MIEYLWPTPILTLDAPFDADQLSELLAYSTGKAAYKRANPPVNKLPDITSIKLRGHYNLFDAEQEVGAPEVWHVFRRWVDTTYEFDLPVKRKNVVKIEIDPSHRMADINLENNTWEQK